MGILKLKQKKIYCDKLKAPIFLKDVGSEKVLVSNKISYGEKAINVLLVTCVWS